MKDAPAQSNYRQIRVTYTEERGGRWGLRILVKRPQDAWQERQVTHDLSGLVDVHDVTLDDALTRVATILLMAAGASPPRV